MDSIEYLRMEINFDENELVIKKKANEIFKLKFRDEYNDAVECKIICYNVFDEIWNDQEYEPEVPVSEMDMRSCLKLIFN